MNITSDKDIHTFSKLIQLERFMYMSKVNPTATYNKRQIIV